MAVKHEHSPVFSSTTDGLTISPGLDAVADAANVPAQHAAVDRDVIRMCGYAIVLGASAGLIGQFLVALIGFVTNLAFFARFHDGEAIPAEAVSHLGLWVLVIPVIGGLIVGFMARYGSKAIRGHGIPEAMEQVLTNESRIPARVTFLKPLSAAISIGTGGPFGAEGPIIATGGALGSVIGQIISTTAAERKTLLAAGAAAGMTAIFGTPVSAVLLAIELLLFEFRPRSIIPVAIATTTAEGVRMLFQGMSPVFPMPDFGQPTGGALVAYLAIGAAMGVISVAVTRIVYAIEDAFEHLPVHWMWWPAIGGLAVGIVGYFVPDTLGVGYYNITRNLSGAVPVGAIATLVVAKFISWAIALGSGTSGGTLAPLLTFGSGLGVLIGAGIAAIAPAIGVDLRVAALVGMATMFAGASRAMLASAVFAFETTLQPVGLLPLLGGCAMAYLTSSLLMRNSIMTEKIARRGIKTPEEYMADALDHVHVRDVASKPVVTLKAGDRVELVRRWIEAGGPGTSHQGFPVVNEKGILIGVLTRRNVLDPAMRPDQMVSELISRPPKFVYDDCTVRQAADHMVNHGVGRLPVVSRDGLGIPIGILTRSDILSVFQRRVREAQRQKPTIEVRLPGLRGRGRGKVGAKT